jgi:hypothetical protein
MSWLNSLKGFTTAITQGLGITETKPLQKINSNLSKVVTQEPPVNHTALKIKQNKNMNEISKSLSGIHIKNNGNNVPRNTHINVNNSLKNVVVHQGAQSQQGGKRKTRRRVHKSRSHKRKTNARSHKRRMH